MSRKSVSVTQVDASLYDEISALWVAGRVDAGASPDSSARTAADGRLTAALARDGVVSFLARIDSQPVGYVIVSDNPFGLRSGAEMTIEALWVRPDVRRAGVAKALLGAVLGIADHQGAEVIASNVPTASREANRFFARLGFSSVIVRRVAPVSILRRRIAPENQETGDALWRRRRSLRQRGLISGSA